MCIANIIIYPLKLHGAQRTRPCDACGCSYAGTAIEKKNPITELQQKGNSHTKNKVFGFVFIDADNMLLLFTKKTEHVLFFLLKKTHAFILSAWILNTRSPKFNSMFYPLFWIKYKTSATTLFINHCHCDLYCWTCCVRQITFTLRLNF